MKTDCHFLKPDVRKTKGSQRRDGCPGEIESKDQKLTDGEFFVLQTVFLLD